MVLPVHNIVSASLNCMRLKDLLKGAVLQASLHPSIPVVL